jgi:PqqD family protein of HPr-rel-A system
LRWRSVSPDSLAWHDFEGEAVLRNARTGSTHLLDRFPAEVLRVLIEARAALSVREILERLGETPDAGDDIGQWETAVQEVLSELRRLELAEPQSV